MAKSKKVTLPKKEVLYHMGQMAFIGAILVVVWAVWAVAKSKGL
jgi:hypothetical protein